MVDEIYAKVKNERQLIQYVLIGVTGVTWDLVTYFMLTNYLAMPYLLANAVSVSLGIANNFFLNAFYNFKVKDRLLFRFIRFYSIGLLGLGLSSVLLFILVPLMAVGQLVPKMITIVIVALIQFYLNKTITFMNMEQKNEQVIHGNTSLQ